MAGIRNLRAVGDSITVTLNADAAHSEGTIPAGCDMVLVQNAGGNTARVVFSSDSALLASSVHFPAIAGGIYQLRKPIEFTRYAVLAEGGATVLHLTPAEGD